MCGIAGFCLGPGKDRTEEDYSTIREEFTRLLVNCQVRGVDAAGAFVVNKGIGNIFYYKAPKKASHLTEDAQFLSLMDKIGPDTVAVIGHTRAATTGSPKENSNNHPIIDDPIIGVHNGMIRNHRELGRLYTKVAEVDSAAIMALLRDSSTEKPLTVNDLVTRLPELEGGYAIAVVDARKPDGIFLARNSNPICMTRNYKLGYLAFASTGEILRETFGEKTRTFLMPSHSVCRIGRGCMKKKVRFYKEEVPLDDVPVACTTCRHAVGRLCWCHCHPMADGKPNRNYSKHIPSTNATELVETQTKMELPTAPVKLDWKILQANNYSTVKTATVMDKGRKCPIHGKKDCHELNHPLVSRRRIKRLKR